MKEIIADLISKTEDEGVKLIAVTKTVPVEIINEAISYGVYAIGENRVQELLSKYDSLNKDGVEIHLIGTLQSNKVKYIIDKVDLIHSVDSPKLVQTIDKYAKQINKIQDILIQVNVSGELTKSGVEPEKLTELIEYTSKFNNVRLRGLMCIPTPETYRGENKRYFDILYKLFVDNNAKKIDNINMDILSMGMSSDYETALECNTTMIRVGTKIFGKRK